jgi:hypothetical protein
MLGLPLGSGDVGAGDVCDLLALSASLVSVDAKEHERRNDQQEQEHHDDLVVLAEGIKHA